LILLHGKLLVWTDAWLIDITWISTPQNPKSIPIQTYILFWKDSQQNRVHLVINQPLLFYHEIKFKAFFLFMNFSFLISTSMK
jgi:hypothetical protein